MRSIGIEEEFSKIKQWHLVESNKIDEKYPNRGGFDNCKECIEERRALDKLFLEKVQKLKEKYHI